MRDDAAAAWVRRIARTREDLIVEAIQLQGIGYLAHLNVAAGSVLSVPPMSSAVECPPWCPGGHQPPSSAGRVIHS